MKEKTQRQDVRDAMRYTYAYRRIQDLIQCIRDCQAQTQHTINQMTQRQWIMLTLAQVGWGAAVLIMAFTFSPLIAGVMVLLWGLAFVLFEPLNLWYKACNTWYEKGIAYRQLIKIYLLRVWSRFKTSV